MIGLLLALGGNTSAGATPVSQPSDHTVIYYNARLAMREGRPLEATRFWFLRNALEDHTGVVSPHDADFHSVTWAALGELGICQDGHPTDESGAGLWPLGLHNWVVRNRNRKSKSKPPRPFDAFELGRQQRFISIDDVLSAEELGTIRLFRGGCARPRLELLNAGESLTAKLSDRQVAARLLRHLLYRARSTLSADRVRGTSILEARLFDIHLQLTAMAAREATRQENERARRGRQIGLSRDSVRAMRADEPGYTFAADSEPARILEASVTWAPSEWMALSHDRRMFLFEHAKAYGGDAEALDTTALAIIDQLVAQREGAEVIKWIGNRGALADPVIWGGSRGESLLGLDDESGFDERAVIALHRGVHLLELGDLSGALRSIALALQLSPESEAAQAVQGLCLRWLSYVASQFEITDELLVTLQQLVPRREYSLLLEDLMWGAALRADRSSFERGVRNQLGRGALNRRIELLAPLASGDVNRFTRRIRTGMSQSPSEMMRFLDQLVQRLEREDAGVRAAHVPTLVRLRQLIAPLADPSVKGRQGRRAGELMDRTLAIIEGVGGLEEADRRDRARALDPRSEVFAGSIRLAPSDVLPWPFRTSDVPAPSIFEPIRLHPEEWRDESGDWVFGWSLGR